MVRGTIGDQPWGWTLGAIGLAQRTVQLVLRADDKEYRITFDRGVVVSASSPMAVDAVTRVALTNHMIAAIQVNEIKRCLAAAPSLDEVDVLAAAASLDPEAANKLRLRLLTQRAARTFAVDRGDFEITECEPLATEVAHVDVRAVIYMGARMNLSEDRLRFGLRKFGSRFVLKPGAHETLVDFGFTPKEQLLFPTLRSPTSLAELEANHREVDPRAVQAVVYALASCNALAELDLASIDEPAETAQVVASRDSDLAIPLAPPSPPTPARTASVRSIMPREPSPLESAFDELDMDIAQGTPGIGAPAKPLDDFGGESVEISFEEGPLTRAITSLELEEMLKDPPETLDAFVEPPTETFVEPPTVLRAISAAAVPSRSMIETFKTGRVTSIRPNVLKAHEVVALIKERTKMLSRGVDHFTLLGVEIGAPIEEIHAAYVELQRNLGAKRLAELDIVDKGLVAAGLLAQLGIAFTVLTDRIRRAEYIASLAEQARKTSPRPR